MNIMSRHLTCLSLLFFSAFAWGGLPASVDGRPLPSLAPMLKQVTPAVVNITTQGRVIERSSLFDDPLFQRFFNVPGIQRERRTQGLGSGVIVDSRQGYILTNHHVIKDAEIVIIRLQDGRQIKAKLVGADPDTDIAVLQIEADNLTAIPSADSSQLEVGDFVVAIGNPFGLGQTVTSGIVSALGRSGLGIESYEDFIQTDASINPGNSGGALVSLRGELVGINTAIIGPSGGNVGIGFAIPINMAKSIMAQLIQYGEVRRGRLGVGAQDLTHELAQSFDLNQHQGAIITQVTPDSPAERAGLRVGDVVTAINGKPLRNTLDLRNVVGLLPVGSELDIEVIRQGRSHNMTATIALPQLRKVKGGKLNRQLRGTILRDITNDPRYSGEIEGILITSVEFNSPAARAGLHEGDIIIGMNDTAIANLEMLEKRLKQRNRRKVWLNILRGRAELYIMLP
ncbi:MAG: DegQ family serine endoprotease [Candidatus Polarisedimenticolaceae bacterium]|nr:DegQ family serine endoprotease [Candidatus Polarisedimenticolaceae bacterium]